MTKKVKLNYSALNTCLIVILLTVLVINMLLITSLTRKVVEVSKAPLQEAPKKANIEIVVLSVDCDNCFKIQSAADFIKKLPNVNVEKERTVESSSKEGKALVKKYKIERLPNLVILGETENLTIEGFSKVEDGVVISTVPPPYYDVASGKVKGQVSVIELADSKCDKCFNNSAIIPELKNAGVVFTEEKSVDISSKEGRELIKKYSIEKVPTLIFSEDAMEYAAVSQAWAQVGTVEEDKTLVLRRVNPPYTEVKTKRLRGIVDFTMLTDAECKECYDVNLHKVILAQNFRLSFGKETVLDVSSVEGEKLLAKYNITLVPTIILSSEADVYSALTQAWGQVGTVEKDGSFVFRRVDLLQGAVYKDMASGSIVNVTQQAKE